MRPPVTLHVSGSEESSAVFELLEQAGVDFRAVASRRQVPLATFGRLRFEGVAEARKLIRMLGELEAAWLSEARTVMPQLLASPEPHLIAALESTRARWRRQARAVLARARGGSVPRGAPGQPAAPKAAR